MKRTACFAYAFVAPFAFSVAALAQDALPGAPEPAVSWSTGTMGIAGGALRVLSGTGKLEFSPGGAHITGDATSDAKGVISYSNVTSGTTTVEYFEGERGRPCRVWAPGAIIGVSADGRSIAVLKGSGTLHINLGGIGVTGDVTADGKGGLKWTPFSGPGA